MKFPELRKAIKLAKTIKIPLPKSGFYKFKVFSFGERGTKISAELLKEITEGMCKLAKQFPRFDYIVSPEPGGHIWGSLVALCLRKPIHILRERSSQEKTEIEVKRKTLYYKWSLYFSNFRKGDKVLIVDDIVSTGGALETIIETLNSFSVIIVGVLAIYPKSKRYKRLEQKYSLPIRFLIGP